MCSLFSKPNNSTGSQSTSSSYSTCNESKLPKETHYDEIETNTGGCSSTHVLLGRQSWSYKFDEIDPSIVDELPPEIQQEVRAWLRPHKRPNGIKQGSSITHYFHPNKKE